MPGWLSCNSQTFVDMSVLHSTAEHGSLLSLGLGDNAITDEGGVNLAEALKRNNRLASLGLEQNHIGKTNALQQV